MKRHTGPHLTTINNFGVKVILVKQGRCSDECRTLSSREELGVSNHFLLRKHKDKDETTNTGSGIIYI